MKYSIKTVVSTFLFITVLFQSSVKSGTIDNASLVPANIVHESTSLNVRSIIKFEAVNDKSFTLKTYHAELSYAAGLNITLTTQPVAAKATVDSRKRLIILEWSAVAPGTKLTADISIASQTPGTYRIQPSSLYYVDNARKTYVTTCSSAEIIVRVDTTPPEAPQQIWSEAQNGAIQVMWVGITATDIAGYNIYRRTPVTGFTKMNTARLPDTVYQDTTVQHGVAYYYAVTAVDNAGNESPLSGETGDTYYDLKIRSITTSGVMAAAVGDVNGDGKADIILSRSYSEVVKKTTISGHKVEIYFGGNTTGLPDVTVKGEKQSDKFGTSLAVVDLNNDGYDDVIVGAPTYSPPNYDAFNFEQGKIYIYAGGAQMSTAPVYVQLGKASQGCYNGGQLCFYADQLGAALAAAGDVDGDGYQDVLIGAPLGATNEAGRIILLYGGPNLASWSTEFRCQIGRQRCGTAVASSRDINGDGYRDIIVAGVPQQYISYEYGKVFLLSGHNSFQQPLERFFEYSTDVADDRFGSLVSSAGDMNGDGFADVAIQGLNSYRYFDWHEETQIFFGGPVLQNEPGIILSMPTDHLALLGDVNSDGYDDIVIDGPTIIFGNTVGDNVPDIVRSGGPVLAVGDVDGDGVKDLVTQQSPGLVVLSIHPYAALPDIVLSSPRYWEATIYPNITVQGSVKGGAKRVLIKGHPVSVSADGGFSANIALSLGNNIFEVVAESQDGKISKRKLLVNYSDANPLSVTITSPLDLTEVSEPFLDVSGVVSDSWAGVTVNGVRAVVSQGTFTAIGIALSEGANTIVATAKDDYGQTASQTKSVILTSRGTVQGMVTDASTGAPLAGSTVTITDAGGTHATSTDGSGRYSMAGVRVGAFTVIFEKSGYIRQSNSGSLIAGQILSVNAALAIVPPLTLSITSPPNNTTVPASALQVNGLVSNSAQVMANGYAASVSGGAYVVTVPLQQGSNTISVTASDEYGQSTAQSLTVTLAGLRDPQEIFIDPTVLTFPQIEENTSWMGYLNVRNVGTANLNIGSTGRHPLPFWIEYNACTGISLPPGSSCMIRVKFAPPTAGTFTRTLEIPSNDADHPLYAVTITGTAFASSDGYVVPDTGQKTCTGEHSRNPLSYTVLGDGTVKDINTGLVWQQVDDGQSRTWVDASSYCSGLFIGGQGGWRIPTRNELLGIVDYGRSQPAADPSAFPGIVSANYWSVTEKDAGAWAINFTKGGASVMSKTAQAHARCVLGPQRSEVPYWDNGDNTVTDLQNGLMWPQQKLAALATQSGTASVCTGNPIAGYTDWRVPTIKELATNRFNNCIMGDCRLWSSTISEGTSCSQGYTVDLNVMSAENRANEHYLTCVRGGRMQATETVPVISNVTVTTSIDTATISWTTNRPTYGSIDYGTVQTYGTTINDPALATSHTIILGGLAPSIAYHFRITAWSGSGISASAPDGIFTTRSEFEAVTLADIGNVTVMEVTGSYDAKKPDGTLNRLSRQAIAKEFLRQHPDDYDFLVIVSNFDYAMPQPEAKAFYLEVRNDTQGIGKTIFDNSIDYGSNGKLQGIIDMGNLSGLGLSPYDVTMFEQSLDTLAHEQLHRWAASVKFRNPDGTLNSALLGKDGTHWSYLLDTDGSLGYGNDWKDNKDGTFTSVSQPKYYSNLDLYLMGMIDKSKVPPMTLIENPLIDPLQLPEIGATIAATPRAVTIDDIVAAEGERVPNASSSQKTFKTGFIFIVRPGTFSGSEPAAIETLRNAWAGKFASLTGGKGIQAGVNPHLSVEITSPQIGDSITRPFATVRGTIINSTGNETGVTVNGIPAAVTGNQFMVDHLPLANGTNTITVSAKDVSGNTATRSVNVSVSLSDHYIWISPTIAAGIAPLDVLLRIDGTFTITNTSVSVVGPVQPIVATTAHDEFTVKLIAEGVYTFTVSSLGPDGNTYQDSIIITVINRNELDRLLKAKWEGMKTKIMNSDITGALGYFHQKSQDKYRSVFAALVDKLPMIAQNMQDIELIYVHSKTIKYRIRKNQIYGGQSMTITYYIYFVKDESGRWVIESF